MLRRFIHHGLGYDAYGAVFGSGWALGKARARYHSVDWVRFDLTHSVGDCSSCYSTSRDEMNGMGWMTCTLRNPSLLYHAFCALKV